MWHDNRKVEVELVVGVCDAVAVIDVGDESNESEKIPAEVVCAEASFEIGERVKVKMAYECEKM